MLGFDLEVIERERSRLQVKLDSANTMRQRNVEGQFATPLSLASDVVNCCLPYSNSDKIRFLEPACGTGSFYSALLANCGDKKIDLAVGVEKDVNFAEVALKLWESKGLAVRVGDFLAIRSSVGEKFNLVIANPPYVRHHHLDRTYKRNLQSDLGKELDIRVSGLAGLYVYFLLACHHLLDVDAVSAWLIPSEFLDTEYGISLRTYLSKNVTLERIHRFDLQDCQFQDALVSSCVVIFKNAIANDDHVVDFTSGSSLSEPQKSLHYRQHGLDPMQKWGKMFYDDYISLPNNYPRFDEFFDIRRGIATGANDFFIMSSNKASSLGIRSENLVPILPSPRYIKTDVIARDSDGGARTEPKLVCIQPLTEYSTLEDVESGDQALFLYLSSAPEKVRKSYLVRNRKVWFRPETRVPSPYLLTYMGRGSAKNQRPVRFLMNDSEAIATNMYLMVTPKGILKNAIDSGVLSYGLVFQELQAITAKELIDGGRGYGGGLRKVEPKELAAMNASRFLDLLTSVT